MDENQELMDLIEATVSKATRSVLWRLLPIVILLLGWGISVEVRTSSTGETREDLKATAATVVRLESRQDDIKRRLDVHRHPEFEAIGRLDERLKALIEQMAGVRSGINEVRDLVLRDHARRGDDGDR